MSKKHLGLYPEEKLKFNHHLKFKECYIYKIFYCFQCDLYNDHFGPEISHEWTCIQLHMCGKKQTNKQTNTVIISIFFPITKFLVQGRKIIF